MVHTNFQAILGVDTLLEFLTRTLSGLDLDLSSQPVRLDVFNVDGDLQFTSTSPASIGLGAVSFTVPGGTFRGYTTLNWPYRFTALPTGRSPIVYQGLISVTDLGLAQDLAIVP